MNFSYAVLESCASRNFFADTSYFWNAYCFALTNKAYYVSIVFRFNLLPK